MNGRAHYRAPDRLGKLQDLVGDLHRAEMSGSRATFQSAVHVARHLDKLDRTERGRAVSMLIDQGEDAFAQGLTRRGIATEDAREGLKHAVKGQRSDIMLVDALLKAIPGRPAEPASPAARLFARHMPRLARALAETATGLKGRNDHFQQAQRAGWRVPVLASTLSLTGVAVLGCAQPRDMVLAAACGALAQGVETIRNAHREGKVVRELGPMQARPAAALRP